MTIKFKFFVLPIFMLVSLQIFAQHNMGFKLNFGASSRKTSFTFPAGFTVNYTTASKLAPSFSLGGFYEFNFGKNSALSAELLYTELNGTEDFNRQLFDKDRNVTGFENSTITTRVSFIALPISYTYQIRNFRILLGFQTSIDVASSGEMKITRVENGIQTDMTINSETVAQDKGDFGVRLGFCYDLSKKVALEINFYEGMNDMADSESTKIKYRQMVFGLRYRFFQKN
ncbi:MAG: PorT family protein [Cyclobacteriaceae bacterium]|nr:PorT family protein [Cyclobacteriaceae bacterium]